MSSGYCYDRAKGELVRCAQLTGDGGFCRDPERDGKPYEPCGRITDAEIRGYIDAEHEAARLRPLREAVEAWQRARRVYAAILASGPRGIGRTRASWVAFEARQAVLDAADKLFPERG